MRGIGDNSGGGFDGDDPTNPYGRNGYIRVARDSRWHRIVGFGKFVTPADPDKGYAFSKAEAWQDLMMECRYKSGTVLNKGVSMKIEPGQLLGAISWLANRWNWTPKTVRVFLDALERDGMIERFSPDTTGPEQSETGSKNGNRTATGIPFKGNQVAMVTICNYEIYQFIQRIQGQPKTGNQPVEGQPDGNRGATEGQHLNKGIKEIIDSYTTDAPSAPRGGVGQLTTLAIPATMREQPPTLPRLLDAEPAKKVRKPRAAAAKTMLPSEWVLPRDWGMWALDHFDVTREMILVEAERFKEFWIANGHTKANWEMTWRNWCRAPFRKWRPKHGAPADIAEEGFGDVIEAETVTVDPWEAERVEAARRRAEENGS